MIAQQLNSSQNTKTLKEENKAMKSKKNLTQSMAPRQAAPSMKEAMPTIDAQDPLKHLTIQIPESLRNELKIWAVQRGLTVREVVERAIREAIK